MISDLRTFSLTIFTLVVLFAQYSFIFTACRAAEGPAGGICEQALPRPGEDRQEPEERGSDPSQN